MMERRSFIKSLAVAGAAGLVLARVAAYAPSVRAAQVSPASSSTLRLSRVFRFPDPATGAAQISAFPNPSTDPPTGDTPIEVRNKHFTEIENFTFLGYVLAHELGGDAKLVSAIQGLKVPDAEFQRLVDAAQGDLLTDEDLGDTMLDVGINWEHFVASSNSLMTSTNPLKITDAAMQAKINSLAIITVTLAAEVNARSVASRGVTLDVTTVAGNGAPITGYFISVQQGGAEVASGFSPASFTLGRQVYQVAAEDFGAESFARWQDGSTGRFFTLDLTAAAAGSAATLTATYSP